MLPAIDGRLGGVRQSLEKQTLSMSDDTVRLLSQILRPVELTNAECVITERCIGNISAICKNLGPLCGKY
jgi:L-fucose/D-arabinose isomerase